MQVRVSVVDVAKYILNRQGEMTAMKLQKLCFYAQAWSLAWDKRSLFREKIEAWGGGPIIPILYRKHKGKFIVNSRSILGNSRHLNKEQKETIDAVLGYYGNRSGWWITCLVQEEQPWQDARLGLHPGERGHRPISNKVMAEYYSSL